MKRISGTQIVINFIGSHPGCTFSEIRTGTGLDSSVVNSAIWATFNDGRVWRGCDGGQFVAATLLIYRKFAIAEALRVV